MDKKTLINLVFEALTSIGTVGAVIYVVYRDIFKQPKLEFELEKIEDGFIGAKKHFRIITISKRKITAKNCCIKIEDLYDYNNKLSPSFYDSITLEWRSPEPKSDIIESLQRNTDITPKGFAKARFIAVTEKNEILLNYDVRQSKSGIQIMRTDRSIPLNQWLQNKGSKIALKLVAYADNSDPLVRYCYIEKDEKELIKLNISKKRPKA